MHSLCSFIIIIITLFQGDNMFGTNAILTYGLLHMAVRLPVLLCAVKTAEGDFRFSG